MVIVPLDKRKLSPDDDKSDRYCGPGSGLREAELSVEAESAVT